MAITEMTFLTKKEALAFAKGVEFVNDSALRYKTTIEYIKKGTTCSHFVVILEDDDLESPNLSNITISEEWVSI